MDFRDPKNPYKQQPLPPQLWRNPLYFIAFGFGSGAAPFAPGTFGTLLAIPFFLLLNYFLHPIGYVCFVLVFILFSIWLTNKVSREINVHDHPGMCIDEFAGFFVTMIFVPPALSMIVLGFLLFRFFDIVKPWPINYLDKNLDGGFGIIMDDVVAGIFSCIILHIINAWI